MLIFDTIGELKRYVDHLYCNSETSDEFYGRLLELAESGCEVDGIECSYTDLCELA